VTTVADRRHGVTWPRAPTSSSEPSRLHRDASSSAPPRSHRDTSSSRSERSEDPRSLRSPRPRTAPPRPTESSRKPRDASSSRSGRSEDPRSLRSPRPRTAPPRPTESSRKPRDASSSHPEKIRSPQRHLGLLGRLGPRPLRLYPSVCSLRIGAREAGRPLAASQGLGVYKEACGPGP
jgi:hypothetical protein